MSYRITIETRDGEETVAKVYEQTVEEIDLRAVMAAVNKRPRKPRTKKGDAKGDDK